MAERAVQSAATLLQPADVAPPAIAKPAAKSRRTGIAAVGLLVIAGIAAAVWFGSDGFRATNPCRLRFRHRVGCAEQGQGCV